MQVNGLTKLLVHSNGGVSIGSGATPPANGLYVVSSVGIGTHTPAHTLEVFGDGNFNSTNTLNPYAIQGQSDIVGVVGSAFNRDQGTGVSGTGSATGVYGEGTGTENDNGIGVVGFSSYGIGGSFTSDNYIGLQAQGGSGEYAGDFIGDVHTTGMFITSDTRLKKNIKEFNNAMDIINRLQPKNYDFKNDANYAFLNLPQGNHYGLLAQDLEKVLPNLVKESTHKFYDVRQQHLNAANNGKAGTQITEQQKTKENITFKSVNYMELIPIMIKAMQEINTVKDKEIADLQNQINELKSLILKGNNLTSLTSSSGGYLKQNVPNPANNNTVISYYLPENTRKAQITITDAKGSAVKVYNATIGEGRINITSAELAAGTYNYTLSVNDKRIDSKQMVITK